MPTIHTRDIETYYEMAGTGEPLLFIHGLGSTADSWVFQVSAFEDAYRVITYDVRGHGRSSHPPGPCSIPQLAADAAALLAALETGPAHVVGLSLGGAIAFQMALDRPALVRTLTVVNSAPGLELRTLRERVQWWTAVGTRLVLGRVLSPSQLGRMLASRLFPKPQHAPLRAALEDQFARNDRRTYNAAARALFAWNVLDRVGDIRCKTLIVSADQDYTPACPTPSWRSSRIRGTPPRSISPRDSTPCCADFSCPRRPSAARRMQPLTRDASNAQRSTPWRTDRTTQRRYGPDR